MAKTKGHKSLKGKRERKKRYNGPAWQKITTSKPIGPRRGKSEASPISPLPSYIKDKHGQKKKQGQNKTKMSSNSRNSVGKKENKNKE